jgi:hypothetical protein
MNLNSLFRIIMGNARTRKSLNSLSDLPIEYQSKSTKNDISNADLRAAEVKILIEEILLLGCRKARQANRQTEVEKDAA